jgi:serine protease Do
MSLSNLPPSGPARRPRVRTALLGAVAAVALTGAAAQTVFWTTPGTAAAQTATTINPTSFADVVDHVRGAVVSVKVKISQAADTSDDDSNNAMPHLAPGDPLERFFRRFGEQGSPFGKQARPHIAMAQGSGFIISPDGYVVTNNHVVENATEVTLTTDDGKTLPAKVVGTDKKTDLALLKITTPGTYQHVEFAAKSPRVGDWVIAVGNPFGLGGTVTAGIVSARGRDIGSGPYDDFLQIDAPVNRGNSGGPTFNAQGQVVGVNTAIFSPSGGSVGIGFAIPAEVAQNVITSLRDKGSVARGWIGVQIQPVTSDIADSLGLKDAHGALVAEAQANSPAAKAGVKSGDVILGLDGQPVDGPRELARRVAALGPDATAQLTYWHDGAEKTVPIKLGTLPNDQQVAKAETGAPSEDSKSQLASLGLELQTATAVPGAGKLGVVVSDIDPDGVAAQKGLKVGDIILEAGGKTVTKPADVASVMSDAKKDGHKAVLLRVKSGDNTHFVALTTKQDS